MTGKKILDDTALVHAAQTQRKNVNLEAQVDTKGGKEDETTNKTTNKTTSDELGLRAIETTTGQQGTLWLVTCIPTNETYVTTGVHNHNLPFHKVLVELD